MTTTTSSPTVSDSDKLPTTNATTIPSPITETTTRTAVTATTEPAACVEAGCEHVCRVKANESSAECLCRNGYVLAEDGKSCEDINECLDGSNGGCQVYCRNLAGSYECLCRLGFSLETDGRTCRGNIMKKGELILLRTDQNLYTITGVPLYFVTISD